MDDQAQPYPVESLTEREYEVLQLLAAGHTNRRVAELLVLSIHTVKWHNRQIYGKLGVANREQAVQRARSIGLLPAQEAQARPRRRLPAPSMPLVGREGELEELQRLLTDGDARLVSIVAPGGMGKTHLALEAARRLAGQFDDGAAFANLAPLSSTEGLVPTMAQVLDLRLSGASDDPQQQLIRFLRQMSLLIVLDNFEHLPDGAPLLAQIVATAPNVRLLVTSRERLQLQAEHVFSLQGLGRQEWETLEQARQDPAVRLLLRYGQRQRSGFTLDERDLGSMRQILQLTEGMPLALILAASWLPLLTPAEIATELQSGLDFLEADYQDLPPRQRSMRGVFGATWERLNGQEQSHFAALSVFRGGFTLEAAQEIAGARPANLRRLLKRSLLARGEDGRLEIHELLRQFAAEQLSRTPSLESAVRDAHSAYYLQRLSRLEPHLKGAQAESAVVELAAEFENVSAAWHWAVSRQKSTLLGNGAFSLTEFCVRTGRLEEGLAAFNHAVGRLRGHLSGQASSNPASLVTLIHLLVCQSYLQQELKSPFRAAELGAEALSYLEWPELAGEDTRHVRAVALSRLAWAYMEQERIEEARTMLKESITLFEETGDSWRMARAYYYLGAFGLRQARSDEARRQHKRSMELFAALGDERGKAKAMMALGRALAPMGRVDEGEELVRNSIAIFRQLNDLISATKTATRLAEVLTFAGKFEDAMDLAAEGVRKFERLGIASWHARSQTRWCQAALHLGHYATVTAQLPVLPIVSSDHRGLWAAAYAHYVAGCARLALGQADGARQQLAESARVMRESDAPDHLFLAVSALSCAHVHSDDLIAARDALREATAIALEWRADLYLTSRVLLAAAALLMAVSGESERAVAFYAAACCKPYVDNSRWWQDVVGCRVDAAAATLSADVRRVAQERGKGLNVWATVAELPEEL